MTKEELISAIIECEWPMFHSVNGDKTHAPCQEDYLTFERMRRAQYEAWNEAICESYLNDVRAYAAAGKNIAREKYIRMMESTDPATFPIFAIELPEVSEEKEAVIQAIWTKMLAQTEKIREKYPILACGGRPLHAADEHQRWASVETYQKCELRTYSEKTLRLLLAHIEALEAQGIELARVIQENSVLCLGFRTMEEAEKAMAAQFIKELGLEPGGGCAPCCGNDCEDN